MDSMSTSQDNFITKDALLGIPDPFRSKILSNFYQVKKNFAEGRDEPAGMASAHFCEVVIRFLQKEVTGNNIAFNRSIGNFADECRKLITANNTSVPESLKVIMPRMLVCLYTFRNKRNIGHVGGDVDSNRIDSATITRLSDWILCELIRVYHSLSIEDAQDLVDALSVKNLPDVWIVAGKKRVLRTDLSTKDQTLLLCYHDNASAVLIEDLCAWIEYSNLSMFRKRVLEPLHKDKFIEYDRDSESAIISPTGASHVEKIILKPSINVDVR